MATLKRLFMIILMIISVHAFALEIPAKPLGFVNDFAGQMSGAEKANLEYTLGKFQEEKKVSIVIVTAQSTEAYGHVGLADMGVAIFDTWKIGNATRNSGILVLITGTSPPYKARIVTGRGMEGTVTDLQSKGIIEQVIKPQLNAGHFAEGVSLGVQALMKLTVKEFPAGKNETVASIPSIPFTFFLIISFIPLLIISLVVFIRHRNNKRRQVEEQERERLEAVERERRVEEIIARERKAMESAIRSPVSTAPPRRVVPMDAWSRDSSYRSPQRATQAPPPRRSSSNPTPSPVASSPTPSRNSEADEIWAPPPPPPPPPSSSVSVDTGGNTAGGGGGDP
jgi:uncharacterized membrane protein YgcG